MIIISIMKRECIEMANEDKNLEQVRILLRRFEPRSKQKSVLELAKRAESHVCRFLNRSNLFALVDTTTEIDRDYSIVIKQFVSKSNMELVLTIPIADIAKVFQKISLENSEHVVFEAFLYEFFISEYGSYDISKLKEACELFRIPSETSILLSEMVNLDESLSEMISLLVKERELKKRQKGERK